MVYRPALFSAGEELRFQAHARPLGPASRRVAHFDYDWPRRIRMEATPPLAAPLNHPRRGQAVFRQLFVPVMLCLSVTSWVFHDEGAQRLAQAGFRIEFSSAVLLASILLLWVAEGLFPQNPEWNYHLLADGKRGWTAWANLGRDLIYLFGVAQLTTLLITFTSAKLQAGAQGVGLAMPAALWPTGAPFLVRVAFAFLLAELCSYWLHRATHRFGLLWRFHATHHVVTELTALKAVRTHPVDNLLFHGARHLPLLLLGAGPDELVTVVYFGAFLSLLAHANVDVAEGALGWLVNFPRYHAVHHSSDLAESNSNFGCHTVLWDRVFRTFRDEATAKPTLQLGVHPVGRRTLFQELLGPLYRAP